MRSLIIASSALLLAACASTSATETPVASSETQGAAVAYVDSEELAAMREAGDVILIDVRTPEEFAAGHLPGALNAPLGTFDPAAIPQEEGRETILYCGSSRRSGIAATQLSEFLGSSVRHLEGGIAAWVAEGGETVTEPERP